MSEPPSHDRFRFRPRGFALGLSEISLSFDYPLESDSRQVSGQATGARFDRADSCVRMQTRDAVRARARAVVRRVRVPRL